MIVVKIKDGLGNQLFQYAFGRIFAIKRNEELLLDTSSLVTKGDVYREYGLKHFNVKSRVASLDEIRKIKYSFGIISKLLNKIRTKIFRMYNIGWNPKALDLKKNYLEGYWQSYKYPDAIREELLKELTLKNPIENKYSEILDSMYNTNSVSIHIRRGDYVSDKKTSKIHNICGLEYYKKAIDVVSKRIDNPTFFVFSDDINWVKENLKSDYPLVFVSNPSIKDYEELVIMSKCKNNIIANSSFSWWSAWLNINKEKVIIAPSKWNNRYQKEYKHLIPGNWIKI